ncbi:50S ribosomal protein L22 [Candidatus Micrarchaeota archaeon]|nr:50S ribosomal protein L22 [Candidatus Micrarchaeota archaeon]
MYSYKIDNPKELAFARVEGVDASFKDLAEVCTNIRRKPLEAALDLLEKASKGKVAIRYRRHNKKLGHRRELGGKKGRYPKKAAGIVLKLLKSAESNAMQKGLMADLYVIHACANKKHAHIRYAPKGRRNIQQYVTSRVEIILKERESKEKKPEEKSKSIKEKELPKELPKEVPKESKELKPTPDRQSEEKKEESKVKEEPKEKAKKPELTKEKSGEKPSEEKKESESKEEKTEEKKEEPKVVEVGKPEEKEKPKKEAEPKPGKNPKKVKKTSKEEENAKKVK